MKYKVTACVGEKAYETTVKCRWDANDNTLFQKCANEIATILRKAQEISGRVTYSYDLPNVWRNGAVGALWFNDPFINVTIIREDGCVYAI